MPLLDLVDYADEESDASNDEDGVWSEAGDDASESEPESPRATCDPSAAAVADEQPADAAGGATAVVASAEASVEPAFRRTNRGLRERPSRTQACRRGARIRSNGQRDSHGTAADAGQEDRKSVV